MGRKSATIKNTIDSRHYQFMKRNNNSRNIYVRGVFKDILKAEDDTIRRP